MAMMHTVRRATAPAAWRRLVRGGGAARERCRVRLAGRRGGGDVTIDNLAFKSLDGDSFAIAHVEFTNTNLSKDEVVKLLTPDTPADDDRELAKKLKADKISIPSIDILGKDGSKIHLAGLTASHVDAGRIEALDVAWLDATGTDNGGPVAVKSGALHVDGVDVAQLLVAGDSGDAAKPSRLGGLTLSGLDIVAPDPDSPAGQTIHFAIGSIEVHNDYAGDSLKQGDAKLVGIVIEPSPGSEAGKNFATLGYSKVELAVAIGASYQAGAKSFALENFTVDGAQMGSVGLKANFTDVGSALFGADSAARMQALLEAGVASVELKLSQRRPVRQGARLLRQAAVRRARQAARPMVGDGRRVDAGDARRQPGGRRAGGGSAEVHRRRRRP